jgi:hypothetical protein
MLNYKRINSASFFEISVPIFRLGEVVDMHSPDTWGMTDRYRIASIDVLNSRNSTASKLQAAWNEQGWFLSGCLDMGVVPAWPEGGEVRMDWRVNTRHRRDWREWDQYCSAYRFVHPLDSRGGVQESMAMGEPIVRSQTKKDRESVGRLSSDVFSMVIRTRVELRFWISVRAQSIPGYSPLEYPDLSMGLDIAETGGVALSLCQIGTVGSSFDPSGWFHCYCVQ